MALTKHQRRRDLLRAQILELREQGKTFDEICIRLHTTIRTVRHALYTGEAERERLRRAHERALTMTPKALGAIEKELDKGNGVLGLRLLEDLGVVADKKGGGVNVFVSGKATINLNQEEIEAARAVAAAMRPLGGILPPAANVVDGEIVEREETESEHTNDDVGVETEGSGESDGGNTPGSGPV